MGSKMTVKKTNTAKTTSSAPSASTGGGSTSGASTNYQALINDAVSKGDYASAAKYETQRNDKINAMNAAGTNTGGYTTTNNYSQYLGGGGASAPSGFNGSASGVTAYTSQQTAAKSKMNANSIEWHTATPERKAELEAENKALNAQYFGGSLSFDANTGYWSGAGDKPMKESGFEYSVPQPTFGNTYGGLVDDWLNKILTREDFSYNPEEDQLFQYYRDMYQREGDRAMQNTLAEVAAGAGGMNSYAVTAAQQQNNYYGAQMADKIPELYQIAYQMYLDDKEDMVENLGLIQMMDETEYNRYRDTMSDWRYGNDFAYNAYRDDVADGKWETEFNYNASRDQISDSRYNDELSYNRTQVENETAYNRALDLLSAGVMPDAAMLQKAGLTEAQARQMLTNVQTTKSSSRSSTGPYDGSHGGGGEGGITEEIEEKAKSFTSNVDLDNYLIGLVRNGVISSEEARILEAKYEDHNEKFFYDQNNNPIGYSYSEMIKSNKGWVVTDDGGINGGWGIDNNAIVTAPNGEQMRLDALLDTLVDEGMERDDAVAAVKKFQKNLNI